MFKKIGCLFSIIAVMVFLTFISVRQGYNTIFNDDWSDNYLKQKVVVQSIYKDSTYMMSQGTGSYTYSFEPIIKYNFNNEVITDTLIWMRSIEEPKFYQGDILNVLVNKFDGKVSKSSNQDRVATGIVNLLQGLFFLLVAYFAFRYVRKLQKSKERDLFQNNND